MPPTLGGHDFVLRELPLTVVEEVQDQVIMSAGADEAKLVKAGRAAEKEYYLRAIVSWDGKAVESPEGWWHGLNTKQRSCVRAAYNKIHMLDKKEEEFLLESIKPVGKSGGA